MRTVLSKSGWARRGVTAIAGIAIAGGTLVGVSAPAGAIETITTTPAVIDPAATMTVTINGFPTMVSGNGYIYWLDFSNLTGSGLNTGTSSGTYGSQTDCTAATGVTFATVSGPGTALPNGQDVVGSTAACQWVSTTKFRFSYKGATGLTSNSVISLTFPASRFTLPAGGQYGLDFTAGATQQYPLSSVCWGNCPTGTQTGSSPLVTIDIDSNGGSCVIERVSATMGAWGLAPGQDNCTRAGYNFAGYNTSANGSGISIAPGGNINFTGDNRVYAQWANPSAPTITSSAPKNVVATSKWQRIQVNWDAPETTGTYPITNYLVKASPGGSVCITRLSDAKFTQCSLNRLTPGTKYTVEVQALTGAGWGAFSAASNVASPYEIKTSGYSRKKLNIFNLFRSEVRADGTALGYPAGTKIHSWYKVGENGTWIKGDPVSSNRESKFTWAKKFDRKLNSTPIWVAFSVEAPGGKWNKNAKFNDPALDQSQQVRVPPVS